MLKHTRVVATVSNQRCDVAFAEALYKVGMNVVRLSMAHMMGEKLVRVMNSVRTVSDRIGILMDTKGLEVCTATMINKESVPLETGEIVKAIGNLDQEISHDCTCMSYKNFVNDLAIDSDILINDGDLEMEVTGKPGDRLFCEIQNDATLGNRKNVDVPGIRINLPSPTGKDHNNILWAINYDLDFIAHSFTRSRQDILDIQRILDECNSPIKIIVRIENQEGVDNIEETLEVACGVMIARGDLGIEVPIEKIPGIRRMLIHKCMEVKKPIIVAIQMLHSMINNPHPTRTEVMDTASAIYYRTDVLMLSGETVYGKYPIETVQTVTKVAREVEKTKLSANDTRVPTKGNDLNVTSFLAKQAVKSSSKPHVKAAITDSYTGYTVRYLVAFCGTSIVFVICYNLHMMRMLGFSYGAWAVHRPYSDSCRGYFYDASSQLIHSGHITRSDMVAYLNGNFGKGGDTSFLEINNVGKVLDAGTQYQLPTFGE